MLRVLYYTWILSPIQRVNRLLSAGYFRKAPGRNKLRISAVEAPRAARRDEGEYSLERNSAHARDVTRRSR